jgi:hypothetical protein
VQDSISRNNIPSGLATTLPEARPVFPSVVLSLTQSYVDEIRPVLDDYGRGGVPVIRYNGPFNLLNGYVAMAHRDQPTLELPELSYLGRAFYASFGLEGMGVGASNGITFTTPLQLLGAVFNWAESEPGTATITNTTPVTSTAMTLFTAEYFTPTLAAADASATQAVQPISWRWDFGDGSAYVTTGQPTVGHTYLCGANNVYTVRVQITDSMSNRTVGSLSVDVSKSCSSEPLTKRSFLPFVNR